MEAHSKLLGFLSDIRRTAGVTDDVTSIPVPASTLECPVCNETFSEPKILPCGHSFCRNCIAKWVATQRGNKVSCPMDRQEFTVPKKGVDGFPTVRALDELRASGPDGEAGNEVESTLGGKSVPQSVCVECRRRIQVKACGHCTQLLCAPCRQLHQDEGRVRLGRCTTRLRQAQAVLEPSSFPSGTAVKDHQLRSDRVGSQILAFKEQFLGEITTHINQHVDLLLRKLDKMKADYTAQIQCEMDERLALETATEECATELATLTRNESQASFSDLQLEAIDDKVTEYITALTEPSPGSPPAKRRVMQVTFECPSADSKEAIMTHISDLLDVNQITQELVDESSLREEQKIPISEGNEEEEKGDKMDDSEYKGAQGWITLGRGQGTDQGFFNETCGVAVCPVNGDVYVADRGNHRIQYFDQRGRHKGAFGIRGIGPGEFNFPAAVAFTTDGKLVVTETGNHRVQMLTYDGHVLRTWGSKGTRRGCFNWPTGMAVDGQTGQIYVADHHNDRIQVFTSDGKSVMAFGSYGSGPGEFQHPVDVAVGGGKIAVTDFLNHRVQVFNRKGEHLRTIHDDSLINPDGITINHANNELLVCSKDKLLVYDTTTARQLRTLQSPASGKRAWRIVVLDHEHALVTLDGEHRVHKIKLH